SERSGCSAVPRWGSSTRVISTCPPAGSPKPQAQAFPNNHGGVRRDALSFVRLGDSEFPGRRSHMRHRITVIALSAALLGASVLAQQPAPPAGGEGAAPAQG